MILPKHHYGRDPLDIVISDESRTCKGCKNCGEHMDDARPYCDEPCRSDHWDRIKAEKRRGK